MAERMSLSALEERVTRIRLNLHLPDGRLRCFGSTGPETSLHIHSHRTLQQIINSPQLALGRGYSNGEWDADTGKLPAIIDSLLPPARRSYSPLQRLYSSLSRQLRGAHPAATWQDRNLWLSRICLGEELFQGCGHYLEPGISGEQAQRIHNRQLIDLLQLNTGQHLLDLHAGWGALPLYLAQHSGVRVTGMVGTREQLQFANSEARRRGLDGMVHFRLGSFHQCHGHYDRILACNLLEHHAGAYHGVLFSHIASMLHDHGLAWLQFTARRDRRLPLSNQWQEQQLHPQCLPVLPGLFAHTERHGLRTCSLKDRSGEHSLDLSAQARRFQHRRLEISQRAGERLTRHWEFLFASQIDTLQRGELRHYELLLGHTDPPRLHTPVSRQDGAQLLGNLATPIPGLARDA
jgi:cyclopropane-fatty-acyl-phospholipid synthase